MGLKLTVWVDGLTGGIQVSLDDEAGGYRLLGPKFIGESRLRASVDLNQRDADQIRNYLDRYFPAND